MHKQMTIGAVMEHKAPAAKPVYWLSKADRCDICDNPFAREMCDIKTNMGPWGLLCMPCVKTHTNGQLGLGKGQRYEKQADLRWLKVEG